MTALILYATPTGALADACDRYFAACQGLAPTTAQTYPPHCTLTGFFHRPAERVAEVVAEVQGLIDHAGPVPARAVANTGLRCDDDWVGFELQSDWLQERTAEVTAVHRLHPGDDALRPKSWLHLSLAYGVDDLAPYRRLAIEHGLDHPPPGGWEVALWTRSASGAWNRLTTEPDQPPIDRSDRP
ncbi:MAG: hypothetical protein AAFN30_07065 [Actinomycetota bacterium]